MRKKTAISLRNRRVMTHNVKRMRLTPHKQKSFFNTSFFCFKQSVTAQTVYSQIQTSFQDPKLWVFKLCKWQSSIEFDFKPNMARFSSPLTIDLFFSHPPAPTSFYICHPSRDGKFVSSFRTCEMSFLLDFSSSRTES